MAKETFTQVKAELAKVKKELADAKKDLTNKDGKVSKRTIVTTAIVAAALTALGFLIF